MGQQSKAALVNLPHRVDSAILAKYHQAGEPTVVVKICGVGSVTPYEYRGRESRAFIFRWDLKIGGHVLRVPARLWMQNNHKLAHDILDHRFLPQPIVVLFELPAAQPAEPVSQSVITLDQTDTTQGASEAVGAHNAIEVGSTPTPETISTEVEAAHPGSLHRWREFPLYEAIAELVKDGPVRIGDVAEKFEASKEHVREAIEFAPNLMIAGGWVKLKEE